MYTICNYLYKTFLNLFMDFQEVYRYAKIAKLAYLVNNQNDELQNALEELSQLGCQLVEGSIRSEQTWYAIDCFQAVCVEYEGKLVVSYRGTNSKRVEDLGVDGAIINLGATASSGASLREYRKGSILGYLSGGFAGPLLVGISGRIDLAMEYFSRFKNSSNKEIIVVGHSLGGFLASYVACQQNTTAYTFDSAPCAKYAIFDDADHYAREHNADPDRFNRIYNFRIENDPISGPVFMIPSDSPFPLGHMGRIINMKPIRPCNALSLECHNLQLLIDTINPNHTDMEDGSSPAPSTDFYW